MRKKQTNQMIIAKNRREARKAKQDSRQNSGGLMAGIFDGYAGGTLSASSYPFQLGSANQYNPLTLNRMVLSYAYMTFGIIQTFIDQPVEDAFRGGIEIECDELDEEDIQLLQDVLIECKDYDAIKSAMKWAKLYGGAGLIINTDQDPMKELDVDAIGEDTPLSFLDADRWELTLSYMLEDRVPCPYNYYGQAIHRTRVLKVNGKDAPSFIRRRLQGWGMSELERVIRDVNGYIKNQDVIYELLDEAKQDVWLLENLNTKLATSNGNKQIQDRLQLANTMKNYSNAIIMDKNDTYEQKQIAFSGLLFNVNVLTGLASHDSDAGVPVVRDCDDDAINVLVVEQPLELFRGARGLALRLFQYRIDFVEDGLVKITESLDFCPSPDGQQGVVAALIASADQTQHHLLIGSHGARIQIQKSSGSERRGHSHFLHERPACFLLHIMPPLV